MLECHLIVGWPSSRLCLSSWCKCEATNSTSSFTLNHTFILVFDASICIRLVQKGHANVHCKGWAHLCWTDFPLTLGTLFRALLVSTSQSCLLSPLEMLCWKESESFLLSSHQDRFALPAELVGSQLNKFIYLSGAYNPKPSTRYFKIRMQCQNKNQNHNFCLSTSTY